MTRNRSRTQTQPRSTTGRELRKISFRGLEYLGLAVVSLAVAFPVYWLVLTALKAGGQFLAGDLSSLSPTSLTGRHFETVLSDPRLLRYLLNSCIVAIATTGITITVSSLAAYALARLEFRGRRLLARGMLFTYVVPSVLLIVPLYSMVLAVGLYDALPSLVIAHVTFGIPFCVWLLRAYFMTLPVELEDAARVDGCSRLGALIRIVLPLSAPGLVAAAMFAFILSWNEYLFALVLLPGAEHKTLPVGITSTYMSISMTGEDWSVLMAASVIAASPVVLVFLGLQRWLIGGMAAGSVKG